MAITSKSHDSNILEILNSSNGLMGMCLLFFDNQTEGLYLNIDITTQMTWVPDLYIALFPKESIELSIITPNTSFQGIDKQIYYGNLLKGGFGLFLNGKISIKLDHFPLYHITKPVHLSHHRGSLSLPSRYLDKSTSVIHHLYSKGQIKHLSFSVVMAKDRERGHLYLGGIPEEVTLNKPHSVIKIIGKTYLWDCLMTNIIMSKNETMYHYPLDQYGYFNTKQSHTQASAAFITFLFNEVYNDEIVSKKCKIYIYTYQRELECQYKNGIEKKLGDISFKIGEWQYKIEMSYFWRCSEYFRTCSLKISENTQSDDWIFGTSFMWRAIYFDYNSRTMDLYLDETITVIHSPDNNPSIKIQLLLLNSITLIIGLIILCLTHKTIK